jgi:hypothetical protein
MPKQIVLDARPQPRFGLFRRLHEDLTLGRPTTMQTVLNAWVQSAIVALALTHSALAAPAGSAHDRDAGARTALSPQNDAAPQQAGSSPIVASGASRGSFTVYSRPVTLKYGEVFNYHDDDDARYGRMALPPEVVSRYADASLRQMAVSGFELDFVRRYANGTEASVPLYELYNHHLYVQFNGPDGGRVHTFGASFEMRNTRFAYDAPYRRLVPQPTTWYPFMHLINTRNRARPFDQFAAHPASPLVQCPCTPQRRINPDNRTIVTSSGSIDETPQFGDCPPWLASNPACSLSTYVGGVRCCSRNSIFVVDTDVECAHDAACRWALTTGLSRALLTRSHSVHAS